MNFSTFTLPQSSLHLYYDQLLTPLFSNHPYSLHLYRYLCLYLPIRAVDFYEGAIREVTKGAPASSKSQGKSRNTETAAARNKTSEAVSLSHDLAKLYLKLGRPESSSRALQKVLHDSHR